MRQSKKKAKATFVELPLDVLETKFDPKWLEAKVVACWAPSINPFAYFSDLSRLIHSNLSFLRPKRPTAPAGPKFCQAAFATGFSSKSRYDQIQKGSHLQEDIYASQPAMDVQDPDNPRKRIYKVFDKIEDVRQDEECTGHSIKGTASVKPNKAVRATLESAITTKAATWGDGLMDLVSATGPGKPKPKPNTKNKREKTPEEIEKKQFEVDLAKILGLNK